MAVWRHGRAATAAILVAAGGVALMMDDASALIDRVIHAPWMLVSEESRPIGTWHGPFDAAPGGQRTLSLRLEADLLSDADSRTRRHGNGFFLRQVHLYRGTPYLKGELVVTGTNGQADSYQVEGPVNFRGTQTTLNVHGADGRAGVLIEKAITRFTPPRADITITYRVPAGSIRKPDALSGYIRAGTTWTAAIEPATSQLIRGDR